jgi:hypothetical protein
MERNRERKLASIAKNAFDFTQGVGNAYIAGVKNDEYCDKIFQRGSESGFYAAGAIIGWSTSVATLLGAYVGLMKLLQ